MKKKLLIFLSILTLLFFTLFPIENAEAKEGCCSWHGGVCCEYGPQPNGRVICYDGWLGSSCLYCEMVKCQPYFHIFCKTSVEPRPIIRRGSRGYWVKELQKMLNKAVYRNTNVLVLDGIFGSKTNHAVIYLQSSYEDIIIDGIVGPQTWKLLDVICNR